MIIVVHCGGCGKAIKLRPARFKHRIKQSKCGELFCSNACQMRKHAKRREKLYGHFICAKRIIHCELCKKWQLMHYFDLNLHDFVPKENWCKCSDHLMNKVIDKSVLPIGFK